MFECDKRPGSRHGSRHRFPGKFAPTATILQYNTDKRRVTGTLQPTPGSRP